jgi:hypothetical protein
LDKSEVWSWNDLLSEDDLDDVEWTIEFSITIPKTARSGAYAIRISGHKVMRLQAMPGRDTLFVWIIVEADARSPYNYRPKPSKACRGLKDIFRVRPCKYRAWPLKCPIRPQSSSV